VTKDHVRHGWGGRVGERQRSSFCSSSNFALPCCLGPRLPSASSEALRDSSSDELLVVVARALLLLDSRARRDGQFFPLGLGLLVFGGIRIDSVTKIFY